MKRDVEEWNARLTDPGHTEPNGPRTFPGVFLVKVVPTPESVGASSPTKFVYICVYIYMCIDILYITYIYIFKSISILIFIFVHLHLHLHILDVYIYIYQKSSIPKFTNTVVLHCAKYGG